MKILMRIRRAAAALTLLLCLGNSVHAETIEDAIRGIEQDLGARVGFFMHDRHTGREIVHSADDRFPLNSTFKLLACGALLSKVEAGTADLSKTILLEKLEIVTYSPAIERAIRAGQIQVSLEQACRMVLSVSDNTAANIVLSEVGGPAGLTDFLRSIGDEVTRLDRWEPELNEATPGDPRDTTTPRAMAGLVENLILGDVLSADSRTTLREWLAAHSVAEALFRSPLPNSWTIHDRTGAGGYGSRSIVAVLYPPGREPIIAALYMTETEASFRQRNAAAARVGRAIVKSVGED